MMQCAVKTSPPCLSLPAVRCLPSSEFSDQSPQGLVGTKTLPLHIKSLAVVRLPAEHRAAGVASS